jgi:hypothetical protein
MKELFLHVQSFFKKLIRRKDDDFNNPYIVL